MKERLSGKVLAKRAEGVPDKAFGFRLRCIHISIGYGDHHAYQRRIGAVVANGIRYHVELCSVLARHNAVTGLIPIDHEAPVLAFSDYVAVDLNGRTVRHADLSYIGHLLNPAATRQTVFGRMRSLPCALRTKIGNEKMWGNDRPPAPVAASYQFICLKNVLYFLLYHSFLQQFIFA